MRELNTTMGLASAERGDHAEAALWFAKSASLSGGANEEQQANLMRAAAFSRSVPRVVRAYPPDGESVARILFDANDEHLASLSIDGQLRIWSISEQGRYKYYSQGVMDVAFPPEGRTFAIGTSDGSLIIGESESWQVLHRLDLGERITDVCFLSPTTVVAAVDRSCSIVDLENIDTEPISWEHPQACHFVAVFPDTALVATGCTDGVSRVLQLADGVLHLRREAANTPDHRPGLLAGGTKLLVKSSPDEFQIQGISSDSTVSIPRNVISGRHLASPDGSRFVLFGGSSAEIYDSASGKLIGKPLRHSNRAEAAAFTTDGTEILTGCWDRTAGFWASLMEARSVGDSFIKTTCRQLHVALSLICLRPGSATVSSACGPALRTSLERTGSVFGLPTRVFQG